MRINNCRHLWRTVLASTMLFPPLNDPMASAALVYGIELMVMIYAAKIIKPFLK